MTTTRLLLTFLLFSTALFAQPIHHARYSFSYTNTTNNQQVDLLDIPPLAFENEEVKINWINDVDVYQCQVFCKKDIRIEAIFCEIPYQPQPHFRYFCNGYQSWTTSEERDHNDQPRGLAPILKPYAQFAGDYTYYHYPKEKGNLPAWSYTHLRHSTPDSIALFAALSEHEGFTLFQWQTQQQQLRIQRHIEGVQLQSQQTFNLFHLLHHTGSQSDCMNRYADLLAKGQPSFLLTDAQPASGWTSWYHYYTHIDEEILLKNLRAFAQNRIPIDYFQIDDGYQQAVGDWLQPNKKFPNGMKMLADSIHAAGYKAGIWLAPLVAARRSQLFRSHPDWFLSNAKGKPLAVANNVLWKGRYYALDIKNQAVRSHLKMVLDTILQRWNYDMIKVDFLFAAAIAPNQQFSAGAYMSDVMGFLRETVGSEKRILGCGVPLASAFGQVDYCRIGNDAHLAWEFGVLKNLGAAERPSTWSTLSNTILRYSLSGRMFRNDPDVFILRSRKTQLSDTEKYTLFLTNNLLGELLFTSDYIGDYTEKQAFLYRSMFPLLPKQDIQILPQSRNVYRVGFAIQQRNYWAAINLSDKPAPVTISSGDYYSSSDNKILSFAKDSFLVLQAHQSICLYRCNPDNIELLGSASHLFSGSEIASFRAIASNEYELRKHPQALNDSPVFIRLPPATTAIFINKKEYKAALINENYWGIIYKP